MVLNGFEAGMFSLCIFLFRCGFLDLFLSISCMQGLTFLQLVVWMALFAPLGPRKWTYGQLVILGTALLITTTNQ